MRRRAASPTSKPPSPKLVLLLGADEVAADRFKGAFKVYIGHHGDAGAQQADLVLPGAAYAEKHGTYVNTEGRVQRGEKAAFPPGEAREDWAILRACRELAGKTLPFDSFAQLRAQMVAEYPAARPRRADRPAVVAAQARRQGRRADPLPDRRLLPDQRHLPQQPDDAALLGGAGPRRRLPGGGGMTATLPALGHELRLGVVPRHDHRHPRHRACR